MRISCHNKIPSYKGGIFIVLKSVLLLLFFSCTNVDTSNESISVKIDTLKIPISSAESLYYGASSVFEDSYIGYNFNNKTLDVFSLSKKKIVNKIDQKIGGGPEDVRELKSLFMFEKDSVLLVSSNAFYYRVLPDLIYKRTFFADKEDSFWLKNHPKFQFTDLYYRSKQDDFLILNANYTEYSRFKDYKLYYKNATPFIKYFYTNDSVVPFNIKFPKEYLENFYGYRDRSSMVVEGDTLYYNFAAIPKIFKKSIYTNEISEINIPTNEIDSYVPLSIPESVLDDEANRLLHFNAALPSFGKLHKIGPYLICIYKNGSNDQMIPFENPILKSFALIFKDNKLIKSIELYSGTATSLRSFTYKNGILIPIGAQNDEDYLNFLHLKLEDLNL